MNDSYGCIDFHSCRTHSRNRFHISCGICSLIGILRSLDSGWNECDVCNILCLTPARPPSSVKPTVGALVLAHDCTRYGRRLGHPLGEGGVGQQEENEDHLESELSIIFITPADLSIYEIQVIVPWETSLSVTSSLDSLLGVSCDMIYGMIYF